MPNRRRVLLDLAGDSNSARRAVREVRDDLRRMAREDVEARIDINERVALQKIERVKQRIERLKAQDASVDVDVKLAGAYAQLDRLNLRLDRLRLKRVSVDVDLKRGVLERTAAGIGTVERGVQSLAGGFANVFRAIPILGGLLESVFSGLFGMVSQLGTLIGGLVTSGIQRLVGTFQSLGNLGALAGPIGAVVGQVVSLVLTLATIAAVAGGAAIGLNALLSAVVALGGALVALVASLGAAVAGLGALAIAFVGVLGPAVIVAIGLFTRFAAILKARQEREQALKQAVTDQKTAEEQRRAALEQSRRAHEQLAQATVDGNRAMAQSALDLRDAELGLQSSQLSVKENRLALAEARRDLRAFLRETGASGGSLDSLFKRATDVALDPKQQRALIGDVQAGAKRKTDPLELQRRILAVQRAQLTYTESVNDTRHAEDRLSQAQAKRADFLRRGIRAYGPYRQALNHVRQADDRLAKAQAKAAEAQQKQAKALAGLTTRERGALGSLDALIGGFTRFAKKASDPIFAALIGIFDRLRGHAGEFEAGLKLVAEAMAGALSAFGRFLTEPRSLSAFQTMAAGAASLVRELGARAFLDFLRIMREVAVSALPAVVGGARSLSGWLHRIAGQPGRIHGAVHPLVAQFRTWAGLAGAVARLVVALFSAAAPAGRSLAGSLTRIVNKWTEWVKANPERVREFFRNAVIRARQILAGIKDLVAWLTENLPRAAEIARHAFETVYKVVKAIRDTVKFIGSIPDSRPTSGRDSSPTSNAVKRAIRQFFHIGFASGGLVPGSGRGDIVPARLEPGEFVLKRSVVQQLSLPVLHAINGGAVPRTQSVAAAAGGDVHHHWHLQPLAANRDPDPEHTVALLQQALERRGGLR